MRKLPFMLLLCGALGSASAADYPEPVQGDYVLKDFRFASGQSLPALRIHYRTLGKPQRDAKGMVTNAVLITHGTGGAAASSCGLNSRASCLRPAACWTRSATTSS